MQCKFGELPNRIIENTKKNYNEFGYDNKVDLVKEFTWFGDYVQEIKVVFDKQLIKKLESNKLEEKGDDRQLSLFDHNFLFIEFITKLNNEGISDILSINPIKHEYKKISFKNIYK